jgi:hypothetical protein
MGIDGAVRKGLLWESTGSLKECDYEMLQVVTLSR